MMVVTMSRRSLGACVAPVGLLCAAALALAGCLGIGSESGQSRGESLEAPADLPGAAGAGLDAGIASPAEAKDVGIGDKVDTSLPAADTGAKQDVPAQPTKDLPAEDPGTGSGADTAADDDPGPDTASPRDSGPADVPIAPPTGGLSCPLQWEECLGAFPGCYMAPCEEVASCPVTGCGNDGPQLQWVVHGQDLCGNGWVVLGDDEGRLGVADVGGTGYEGMDFTLTLDGEPHGRCSIMGLPTGAIRYQMSCVDLDGERMSATVLEEGWQGPCGQCQDSSGCYELRAAPIACMTILPCPEMPDQVRIDGDGCRVVLRLEAEPAPGIDGWISHAGIFTLRATGANVPSVHCSLPRTAEGFGPAVCTMGQGAPPMEIDAHLVRVPDDACPLPQCISEQTCKLLEIGDRCKDGACTCEGNPACGEGTVCVPRKGAPGGCGPERLWRDPRACISDADCLECLAGQQPACCDEIIDGSALDAVNYLHDCPACCSCSQSCEDVVAPTSVSCRSGRCTYGW
jgi:hypothetical protein